MDDDGAVESRDGYRLPWYRRVAFGTGHVLHVLAAAMWYPYGLVFFELVLQLSAKSTGTIILVAQVVGAISTPFVGMWSDQCRCNYGRRKIFHLMGVVAGVFSFFFVWHECFNCADVSEGYQVLYFSCFAAVFQFGWAAAQIAQLSLIPELTTDKSIKVELNSIRYGFTMVSFLTVFVCFWVLLEKVNNSVDTADLTPDDKSIFWITALIVTGLGLMVTMFFQIFIRENPNANPPKLKWYKWLTNPEFYLVACAFVAARIVILLPQGFIPLYLIDTLKMDRTSIAKGPLFLYISSIIATLLMKRINKSVGEKFTWSVLHLTIPSTSSSCSRKKRKCLDQMALSKVLAPQNLPDLLMSLITPHQPMHMTYFLGVVLVWGAVIWFWVKDPTDDSDSHFNWARDNIYGATILLGAGGSTLNVISFTMISYLVKNFTGSSAFVYGWMLFGDRLFNGVLIKIIVQVQPTSSNPSLPEFYRHVLVFTLLAVTAVGLIPITLMVYQEWWQKRHPPAQANRCEGVQNCSSKATINVDPDERQMLLSASDLC